MPNSASLNRDSILGEIKILLSNHTQKHITLDSEIYYDLGIYGEDLFDVFEHLVSKFGVNYSNIDAAKIAPGEGGGLLGWIARLTGSRPYQSFKVRDLVNLTYENARSHYAPTP